MKHERRPSAVLSSANRARGLILLAGLALAVGVGKAAAQTQEPDRGEVLVSIGVGGTLYSVDTRLDEGRLLRGGLAYVLSRSWMLEVGVRRHDCLDCHRFWILDAGAQWRRPGERLSPFFSAGGGRASDPDFMGTEWGPYASVGSWVELPGAWKLQLELRGRMLGGGLRNPDGMGELTVAVTRRAWRRAPRTE
jgi:hypothetical protein